MKIAISAESTIDLNKEQLEQYGIETIPFTINLGEETRYDGDLSCGEIIAYVNETGKLPKTSAINQYAYEEYFKQLKEKGYDAIIHITLSSAISATNSQCNLAANEFSDVYVIDSKSLSSGIALLGVYASQLRDEGCSADEIYNKVLQRVPFIQASFVLARLDYLYKGGRCSSIAHFFSRALGIRPQIVVKDGRMVSGKKYRGADNAVIKKYCEDTLAEFNNPDKSLVFVTYTSFPNDNAINIAIDVCRKAGFKNIILANAGATITSHCGERTLGILYMNDGGKE